MKRSIYENSEWVPSVVIVCFGVIAFIVMIIVRYYSCKDCSKQAQERIVVFGLNRFFSVALETLKVTPQDILKKSGIFPLLLFHVISIATISIATFFGSLIYVATSDKCDPLLDCFGDGSEQPDNCTTWYGNISVTCYQFILNFNTAAATMVTVAWLLSEASSVTTFLLASCTRKAESNKCGKKCLLFFQVILLLISILLSGGIAYLYYKPTWTSNKGKIIQIVLFFFCIIVGSCFPWYLVITKTNNLFKLGSALVGLAIFTPVPEEQARYKAILAAPKDDQRNAANKNIVYQTPLGLMFSDED